MSHFKRQIPRIVAPNSSADGDRGEGSRADAPTRRAVVKWLRNTQLVAHTRRGRLKAKTSVSRRTSPLSARVDDYRAYRASRERDVPNAVEIDGDCMRERKREKDDERAKERERERDRLASWEESETKRLYRLYYRGVHSRSTAFTAVRVGRLTAEQKMDEIREPGARQRSLTTLSAYCRARLWFKCSLRSGARVRASSAELGSVRRLAGSSSRSRAPLCHRGDTILLLLSVLQ